MIKTQHVRHHKVTLSLKINKVPLDINIKVPLFYKGNKATLVIDIKVVVLIKEDGATLFILDIKAIPILKLFKLGYLKERDQSTW